MYSVDTADDAVYAPYNRFLPPYTKNVVRPYGRTTL